MCEKLENLANDLPIFESVRVTKKDFSVYELYRKYKKGQLRLDVDFQRRKVWEPKQKSELIESILMGLPLPIFYFKQQTNSDYVVVDGEISENRLNYYCIPATKASVLKTSSDYIFVSKP